MRKIHLSIKAKMLLYIFSVTLLIYIVALGYISINLRKKIFSDARKLATSYSKEYANLTKAKLNHDLDVCRTLARVFEGYKDIAIQDRDKIYLKVMENVINKNPHFYSVWTSWELGAVDTSYTKDHGRVRHTFYRDNKGEVHYKHDTLEVDQANNKNLYSKIKKNKEEILTEPYPYSYTGNKEDEILEASPCVPILNNGNFVGLAGADVELTRFKEIIDSIKPFDEGYAFLLANNGGIVAHPNKEYIGKLYSEVFSENDSLFKVTELVKNGMPFSFNIADSDADGDESYVTFSPISIGQSNSPWAIGIVVPTRLITLEANKTFRNSVIVGVIGLLVLLLVIWFISNNISHPLVLTTRAIKYIARGELDEIKKIDIRSHDEIGQMSLALNELVDGLKNTSQFAKEIGEGNLHAQFTPQSENDVLGNSLLEMQRSLKIANEEENKRKLEDQNRNWVSQGLAKFAELLRNNNDNLEVLSFDIIRNLVKYVEANQGGLFIINDDNKDNIYLDLAACYAFEKKKIVKKQIYLGEGLVGACLQEKETIYITDVPEEYIHITSGLGDANPTSILIVPLKFNDQIFGVIEIASFAEFQPFQIEFIEKIGESIASTISNVKINTRTAALLAESQEQAEEMRSQEEEMRQNLEELNATQEEIIRSRIEMENTLNAINETLGTIEYNRDGYIQKVNSYFLDKTNNRIENYLGRHHSEFISALDAGSAEYKAFWEDLRSGIVRKQERKIKLNNGKTIWFHETYSPIKDERGYTVKILAGLIDITELKTAQIEMQDTFNALDVTIGYAEMGIDGTVLKVNGLFLTEWGHAKKEDFIGRNRTEFVDEEEANSEAYKQFWNEIVAGNVMKWEKKFIHLDGTEGWKQETFTPIKDLNGRPYKVFCGVIDITDLKNAQDEVDRKDHMLQWYLESINKGFALIEFDFDGNILSANENFCKITGYAENELLGANTNMLLDSKIALISEGYKKFWQDMKKGKTFEGSMKRKTKEGKSVYIQGVSNPLFDKNGQPIKIMEIGFDVTAQKQLLQESQQQAEILRTQEEELKQNMEELSSIQDEMHKKTSEMQWFIESYNKTSTLLEFDFNGMIIYVNEILCEILGYQAQDLIGRHHSILFGSREIQDTESYDKFWLDMLNGKTNEGIMKRMSLNNSPVYLKGMSKAVFDKNGSPLRVIEIGYDITPWFRPS